MGNRVLPNEPAGIGGQSGQRMDELAGDCVPGMVKTYGPGVLRG